MCPHWPNMRAWGKMHWFYCSTYPGESWILKETTVLLFHSNRNITRHPWKTKIAHQLLYLSQQSENLDTDGLFGLPYFSKNRSLLKFALNSEQLKNKSVDSLVNCLFYSFPSFSHFFCTCTRACTHKMDTFQEAWLYKSTWY